MPCFSRPAVSGDELDIREIFILTRSWLQAELAERCVKPVVAQPHLAGRNVAGDVKFEVLMAPRAFESLIPSYSRRERDGKERLLTLVPLLVP